MFPFANLASSSEETLSLLRATLESTADGILVVDRAGRVAAFNTKFAELWRIPDTLLATRDDALLLDYVRDELADPDAFIAKVRQLYDTPEATSFDLVVLRDGRTFERYSQPQRVGSEVTGRVWSFRDVTVRLRAERDRQAAEARLRVIFEHTGVGIAECTPEGRFLFVNGTLCHILGYCEDELYRMTFLDVTHPDDRARNADIQRSALSSGGSSYGLEKRYVHKAGRVVWAQVSVNAVRDVSGAVNRFVAIIRDITESRQMQEQLALADRLASLGGLAAGVAHEINNPLAALMGSLELLLHAGPGPGAGTDEGHRTEALEIMREASGRIREIARDLLVFARAESDVIGPVDVAEVLESSLRLAANQLRHRARIVRRYNRVPPVAANGSRLGQVFLNLLVNAAQAIDEGHADRNDVTITVERCGDDRVAIEVADTGEGMPPNRLERLFQPFSTTKAQGHGLGLGLAICHRIVTQYGGTICARSIEGQGTTFRIELPVQRQAESPAPSRQAPRPTAVGLRALIVDDDALVRGVIQRLLEMGMGVHADVAGSASEALSHIRSGARYDAILCDLMMPMMSGSEFFVNLQALNREQSERVIFTTGGAFTPSAAAFLESQSQPVVEKPIDLAALKRAFASLRPRSEEESGSARAHAN
jgi:PAS domain S-box-containing protein